MLHRGVAPRAGCARTMVDALPSKPPSIKTTPLSTIPQGTPKKPVSQQTGSQKQNAQVSKTCDDKTPGPPAGVKALVINETALQVVYLAPNDTACLDSFVLSAKDTTSGSSLPQRTVSDGLSAVYAGLQKGHTYEFSVTANSKAKGGGKPLKTRAALPPALLDAKPGAPERFRAVATGDSTVKLTWDLPAGNPKVDGYVITVRQTNSTGYPLKSGAEGDATLRAAAGAKYLMVRNLKPESYYAFVIQVSPLSMLLLGVGKEGLPVGAAFDIERGTLTQTPTTTNPPFPLHLPEQPNKQQSASKQYGDSEANFAFRNTPAEGALPPKAPRELKAQAVSNGTVVLSWKRPYAGGVDLYNINITEIDPKNTSKVLSATNTIPYRNTTAVINALGAGLTYRFVVQSLSIAYEDGESDHIDFTMPSSKQVNLPPSAPQPVRGLAAKPSGKDAARVSWQPPAQGPAPDEYLVQVSDQTTGRPMGTSYMTRDPYYSLQGLPADMPLEIAVQGMCGGQYYGQPQVVVIELPPIIVQTTTIIVQQPTYLIGSSPVVWPAAIPFYDPFVWW